MKLARKAVELRSRAPEPKPSSTSTAMLSSSASVLIAPVSAASLLSSASCAAPSLAPRLLYGRKRNCLPLISTVSSRRCSIRVRKAWPVPCACLRARAASIADSESDWTARALAREDRWDGGGRRMARGISCIELYTKRECSPDAQRRDLIKHPAPPGRSLQFEAIPQESQP